MPEKWAETGIFTALETNILDTVSGGSVLEGLELLDWCHDDILSSHDSFSTDGCIPGGEDWHLAEWGCQSPSPGAPSAHHQCISPIFSLSASNTTDEVLLCPAQDHLTSRGSATGKAPGNLTAYNALPQQSQQPWRPMCLLPPERWATATESHSGSDDSSTFALEMLGALPAGFPLLSHADLGLQPLSDFLPSGLHITPLSSGLTAEAPNGFQEPQGILKLPSFSDILQASLLAQTPATGFMDGPVAADRDDMLKLPSLGLAARPGLQLEEASGMTAEQAEPVKHAEALWTRQIPAGGAAELCKKSDDYEQPDKDLGMPMVPEQAMPSAKPSRCAASQASARVAMMDLPSDDSAWEPEQTARRPRCARQWLPREETEPVTELVLRNRVTQKQYLQRKKGKMAAVHAHVPELEARLARLQGELAPLVERHHTLSDTLPWKEQLEEIHFLASLGNFQESMPPGNPESGATFLQRYMEDPLAACTRMLGQREPCQPKDSDAKTADVATIEAPSMESIGSGSSDMEKLRSHMPDILARLRLSKRQKEQLAKQGEETANMEVMLSEGCNSIASCLQNMLTGSMDSMRVGWRRSLQSHVLCGRLAGLARHGADVESCSTALCTKVLSTGQAAKLAHMTDMHPGACAALCMEVRCQKAGPKLSGTLPAAPKVPRDPKAGVPQARTLIMTDISTSEVTCREPFDLHKAPKGRHVMRTVWTEPEGSIVKPGAMICSKAMLAARSAAALSPPVIKREREADIEDPSQETKRFKGDKRLSRRRPPQRPPVQ